MKHRYQFTLATPADDPAIRQLLATNPVPGTVALTYEREPNYFHGCSTMGHFYQVGVARTTANSTLVGLSCRATRPLFVNGQEEEVGYLGQMRVVPQHQGRGMVAGAFCTLRRWHADGRVSGYITTIVEGNTTAEGILVQHARRGFPTYRAVARLCTLALVLVRAPVLARLLPTAPTGYMVRNGTPADLEAIVAFLRTHGAARQFFPAYTLADFCASPLTRDFCPHDFVIVSRNDQIVAVAGLWNQSAYKQTIVRSYRGPLRWLRPLSPLAARIVGVHPLPAPGSLLRSAYASFLCVRDDDPAAFAVLLRALYRQASRRGLAYLLLGLTTSDPLLPIARRCPHIPYYSHLYTVCWPTEHTPTLHDRLDGRTPYVEIAAL